MKIKSRTHEYIRMHCRSHPDKESCGYIFGNNVIRESIEGINLDDSAASYTIDPKTTIKSVFRKDFMGVYHSHIGAPIPSTVDKDKKKYKDKLYLIYSISEDRLTAHKWNGKRFSKEEVKII